jgi:starvation-inducible DNA-binding protein
MYKTKNDIPEAARVQLIDLLNKRLAAAIDLSLQSKQAHWNVKGPQFISLHELFDKIHIDAEEAVDLFAERIMQLGGMAEGTVQAVGASTVLATYPLKIVNGKDHVESMATALAGFAKSVRQAIELASKLDDADTADIFTGVSKTADKNLWFVESHTQTAL